MKKEIRKIILSEGADLCGFANIDRFNNAPTGFKPTDIFPECKSVISIIIALPKGLAKIKPRLIYGHYNFMSCPEVDITSFNSAKKIEQRLNCLAVPIPCDSPYEYWDKDTMVGKGLLSMKHTAVQAGLGSLGKNTLFINRQYGNMVTLGAILTNLDIQSDELSENICIHGCKKCVESCPINAIEENTVNQKRCRSNAYGKTKRGFDTVDCNKCRTICPINYLDIKR